MKNARGSVTNSGPGCAHFRFQRLCFTTLALISLISLIATSGCSNYFYQPDRNLYYPPGQFNLDPKEIAFKSRDGTQLYGWFFAAAHERAPGTQAKGTVIQFHGNAENMTSHYLSLAWVATRGYNLFVFDYRGYGKSEGSPSQEGLNKDALAALDQAWSMHQASGGGRFVVEGQSLGGAVALRALQDWDKRDQLALLVLDSTFLSYRKVAQRFLARHWYSWILSPLPYLVISDAYSAQPALASQHSRLLVIHDHRDPVVSFACGQEIFEQANSPKDFWELDQGMHVGAFYKTSADDPAQANRDRFAAILDSLPDR